MKFRKRTFLLILILGIYSFLIIISGGKKVTLGDKRENVCYLYSEQTEKIEGVVFEVDKNDKVGLVLNKLKEGDLVKGLMGVIPKELEIIYYTDDSRRVTVNFNDYYYVIEPREELILRASLVRSLTSYGNIDFVEILVEGVPLRETNGPSIGRLSASDVYLTLDETFIKSELRAMTIYYPKSGTGKLTYELVELPIDTNKKIEESLLEYMMESSTYLIFPEGTQLLDVYTHDDVCYVDFSEGFQTGKLPEGMTSELLIYAVVNSLVKLPDVNRVQIFIEGRVTNDYQGVIDLQKLLSKNDSIVE